ncbi:MAG TPA: UDP-3-O-acyl-N-acetylglucosamine deacetylase [Fimbriimonadaceae bacterium]|nr:UDP-3-O-acyl-N-acetylglucosamine deacetylase [Fimbriimonadaceae bacterium]
MNFARRTLSREVVFEGLGLHSGIPVRVTVHPGEAGIWFRLGSGRWQARPENVTDTTRCTKLGDVSTIEHLMSALAGLEITDVEVELTAGELPALDGSALGYVEGFRKAGFASLPDGEMRELFSRVFFQDLPVKIAIGKGDGHWRYTYEVADRWPGEQAHEALDVVAAYAGEIAPARTFALAEEVPMVLAAGLAKGLDIEKALILGIEGYKNDARFPDEPARHKLLDLIGDLYLAGIPARLLNVSAEKSGHRTNVEAAARLLASVSEEVRTK